MVDPGLCHFLEESIGAGEADTVAGAYRGIAEGLGEKGFADTDWADQEDVLTALQKVQREDGVQQSTLHGYRGGPVEVFQSANVLKAGLLEVDLEAAVITPGNLVGEEYL